MATWWTLTIEGEPNEVDLEHVAQMVKDGFTSGQLIEETDNAGCDRCGETDRVIDNLCQECFNDERIEQ